MVFSGDSFPVFGPFDPFDVVEPTNTSHGMLLLVACILGFFLPALMVPKRTTLWFLTKLATAQAHQERDGNVIDATGGSTWSSARLEVTYQRHISDVAQHDMQLPQHQLMLSDLNPAALWGILWILATSCDISMDLSLNTNRMAPFVVMVVAVALLFSSLSESAKVLSIGMCAFPHIAAPLAVCQGILEQYWRYKRMKEIAQAYLDRVTLHSIHSDHKVSASPLEFMLRDSHEGNARNGNLIPFSREY